MPGSVDIIVLGLSPTGLYAVREAARAGYKVLGVGAPGSPGLYSRFLTEKIVAQTPEARVAAILKRVQHADTNEKKPVLVVASDQDLEAVTVMAEALSKCVYLQGSYLDGLASKIMDKDQFYQLCNEHGIAYPALWSVRVEEIKEYRDQIHYPSMIKPARMQDVKHLMAGRKGWVVRDRHEFDAVISKVPFCSGTLLIQEIVPGPESNITLWCGYFDSFGEVRQRFTARKLRQYPAGFGSASLVQSEICVETAALSEKLLTALGFRGIAAAEFKRDVETGQLKIIEVNPRPSLWFSVATKSGVRLVESAISEAMDAHFMAPSVQKNGVLWRYTTKDLASRAFYALNKDFLLPAPDGLPRLPVTDHARVTSTWDDPAPAVAELIGFLKKLAIRIKAKGLV